MSISKIDPLYRKEQTKPNLGQARFQMKRLAAAVRYRKETGGIEIAGARVATDDRSKLLLNAAAQRAAQNPAFSTKWKTVDGSWRQLNSASLMGVHAAVFDHVLACFAREAELVEKIDAAGSIEELAGLRVEVTAFWPAKGLQAGDKIRP